MTAITILTTPTMIREKSTRLQMRRAKLDLVGEKGIHYFLIGRRGDLIGLGHTCSLTKFYQVFHRRHATSPGRRVYGFCNVIKDQVWLSAGCAAYCCLHSPAIMAPTAPYAKSNNYVTTPRRVKNLSLRLPNPPKTFDLDLDLMTGLHDIGV